MSILGEPRWSTASSEIKSLDPWTLKQLILPKMTVRSLVRLHCIDNIQKRCSAELMNVIIQGKGTQITIANNKWAKETVIISLYPMNCQNVNVGLC